MRNSIQLVPDHSSQCPLARSLTHSLSIRRHSDLESLVLIDGTSAYGTKNDPDFVEAVDLGISSFLALQVRF